MPSLICRDFILGNTKCGHGCRRTLTSGTAWIVRDNGEERPYGEHCLEKHVFPGSWSVIRKSAPDLTLGAPENNDNDSTRDKSYKPGSPDLADRLADDGARKISKATGYLLLRMDRLPRAGFRESLTAYEPLIAAYEEYRREGALSMESAARICNIIRAIEEKAPTLSARNLCDAYAMSKKLDMALQRTKAEKSLQFLASIKSSLQSRLTLSERQIKTLNEYHGVSIRHGAFT